VTTHISIIERPYMFEQINPDENHVVHLIRSVAKNYLQIRFYYEGKRATEKFYEKRLRHIYAYESSNF
jgi:hypothetical protein